MEIITILIASAIIIIILAPILRFSKKNVMKIKQIGEDKELNKITNLLPENEQICREILKMLNNENVKIKQSSENSQASFYIVATNSILIANIKNTFTRIQTIAHECIHSTQDKRLLWFNFIFSNIYLFYFAIITILTIFNVITAPNIYAIILVMMSIMLYFVRSYIETDAMTRARFLARDYLENKTDLIKQSDIDLIIENYDKINDIGIKIYNYKLLFDYLTKIMIYCIIAAIKI